MSAVLEEKKIKYKNNIDKISKESFNGEQKTIAKQIIDAASEENIDAIYQFISQRVKTGFVFDAAPEVNHGCVALLNRREDLDVTSDKLIKNENALIIGENYDALKNLLVTYTNQETGKGLIDFIYIDPPYNTEKAKNDGKPENMLENIVEGMLKKHFAEKCLLEQPYIKNPDQKVNDFLKENITKFGENTVIRQMARIELGQVN